MEKVNFYFYFNQEKKAKDFIFLLEKIVFKVDYFEPSEYYIDRTEWCLIVSRMLSEREFDLIHDKLEYYANQFEGRYDGYEKLLV